jgi:hypothetical protein
VEAARHAVRVGRKSEPGLSPQAQKSPVRGVSARHTRHLEPACMSGFSGLSGPKAATARHWHGSWTPMRCAGPIRSTLPDAPHRPGDPVPHRRAAARRWSPAFVLSCTAGAHRRRRRARFPRFTQCHSHAKNSLRGIESALASPRPLAYSLAPRSAPLALGSALGSARRACKAGIQQGGGPRIRRRHGPPPLMFVSLLFLLPLL